MHSISTPAESRIKASPINIRHFISHSARPPLAEPERSARPPSCRLSSIVHLHFTEMLSNFKTQEKRKYVRLLAQHCSFSFSKHVATSTIQTPLAFSRKGSVERQGGALGAPST
ncbi:hypothetical protein EVAR_34480_1 [Eumeta japonica]|uniref:Uncharacterized protein n=1 Tax=Eumeta variegata TaxID=151549 RepID=A0A4C1WYA0_EUMVA|nr:hypothetical protein EVAR_34480_1 [Eumeta japonica]